MKVKRTLLLICLLGICSTQTQAAPIPTKPVYTNKTRFRIPYRFDAAEMQRLGSREIRLYVSVDAGQHWQHVQSVAPQQGKFEFQAPRDGEYWFAVKTVDSANRLHPDGNQMQAGLRVIVDTRPPALQLNLTQTQRGQIQVRWSAVDPQINLSTLKLEVVEPGATRWTPITISARQTGKTTWPVRKTGLVTIRGSVSDLAGNLRRAQTQLRITDAAGRVPRPVVPDFRQPIADHGDAIPDNTVSEKTYPESTFPETTFPENANLENANSDTTVGDLPRSTPPSTEPADGSPELADSADGEQIIPPRYPRQDVPDHSDQTTPDFADSATQRFPGLTDTQDTPESSGSLVSDRPESRPPLFQGRYPRTDDSRSENRQRVVGSRQFHIDYKIEDVGPSGISRVELYITQDNGRKWWKYGDDRDRQSPIHVEVPDDGSYGFALRVKSGAGLSDPPPQPSETPDIVVVVDQTAPVVKLLPVKQGQGTASNQLQIRWTMDETNPARLPVALFYSGSPQGPWEPISGWQADRGSHMWNVGSGLPPRIYIRLTARDAAGNTTSVETRKPVLVDLSRPSARIVNIELIDSNGFQP